jgi:hypothetical protein
MSCTADEPLPENDNLEMANRDHIKLKSLDIAKNPANNLDYIGILHAEILEGYIQDYSSSTELIYVINGVEAVAFNDTNFYSILNNYQGLNANETEWVIDNTTKPQEIINITYMSQGGKDQMSSFISMLDSFENEQYSMVYNTITAFEKKVDTDSSLTGIDKQTILATTSTARYSIAFENRGGGRGWNKTKVGIIASINSDVAEAVTTSVAANIMAE